MILWLVIFLALLSNSSCHHFIVQKIEEAAKALEVPGAAIGVVSATGQLLFSHCLGHRKLREKSPVDDQSLFRIGSITKSLTSLMISHMVEKGLLNWDDSLEDLLPSIRLSEKFGESVTLREALGMSTGTPAKGLILLLGQAKTGEDRIKEINTFEPTSPRNSKFQYSNHMFAVAGYAAAHVYAPNCSLDEAYERAMRDLVFERIGMDSSFVHGREFDGYNYCHPHAVGSSGVVKSLILEDEYMLDSIQPAGSILANLSDMLKYVAYEISSNSAAVSERLQKHINITPELDYGLGIVLRNHPQYGQMYGHRGGSIGFSTSALFSRKLGFGVVTLTNKVESGDFMNIVDDILFEYFSTGILIDVLEKIKTLEQARKGLAAKMQSELTFETTGESNFVIEYDSDVFGVAVLKSSISGDYLEIGRIKSRILPVKSTKSITKYRLVDSWACMQEIYVEVDDSTMVVSDQYDEYLKSFTIKQFLQMERLEEIVLS